MRMKAWVRQPQEREGKYQFNGQFVITNGVSKKLRPAEIIAIYMDICSFVREKGGADYFQVYKNEFGEKLYFIDQGPADTPDTEIPEDERYCILLCSYEY